jgi:hypothetical protein
MVNQAEATLQQRKYATTLRSFTNKGEALPKCISSDPHLTEKYYGTDLTLAYVFEECKALKALKGVEVNVQNVATWFREFIQMGWTKNYFNQRLAVVKRATIYGAFIDFSVWCQAEALYTDFEAHKIAENIIERKIRDARDMRQQGVKLTPEQEKFIRYAAAQKFMKECSANELRFLDERIEEEQNKLRNKLKTKKLAIMNMPQEARERLFQLAEERGELKPTNEQEGSIMKIYLEEFSNQISDKTVQEVLDSEDFSNN